MAGDTHDASSLDRLAVGSVGFGLLFGLGWWVLVVGAVKAMEHVRDITPGPGIPNGLLTSLLGGVLVALAVVGLYRTAT